MNLTRRADSYSAQGGRVFTRRSTTRDLGPHGRIAFGFATSALLLVLWTALAVASPAAWAQEPRALPDVTGNYDGPATVTDVCEDGTIMFDIPGSLIIASQQGQTFSGTLDDGEFILNGNVDSSGGLTGTYSINLPVFTGGGKFTGQLTGDQIQLSLAGTLSAVDKTCTQTYVLTATRSASTGPKADL